MNGKSVNKALVVLRLSEIVRKNKQKNIHLQVRRQACTFALPLILTAIFKTPAKGQVLRLMAKDSKGRKFNRIPEYVRKQNGKTTYVKAHIRSNRSDCKGEQ